MNRMQLHPLLIRTELDLHIKLDENVVSALHGWVIYGLDPGSFTRAVLMNDRKKADMRAHANLLEQDVVKDHFLWVDTWFPSIIRSMKWTGYVNANQQEIEIIEKELLVMRLKGDSHNPIERWITRHNQSYSPKGD